MAFRCLSQKPGFAQEWARVAKEAGCKYLVFTSKHHDGFALHDSKVSDYDAGCILNRDLLKEIVDPCRSERLRVGFYHSVIGWPKNGQLIIPGSNNKPLKAAMLANSQSLEVEENGSQFIPRVIKFADNAGHHQRTF